jgi:hypothetical protein
VDRYGTERRIVEILNRGYGDNATSALDRVIAGDILSELINVGWTSGEELAYLVEAAGGEIRIPESLLTEPSPRLLQYRSDLTNEIVFQTKDENARLNNPSPADRESGESRTVHSGKINVIPIGPDDSAGETEEENKVSDS